MSKPCKNCAEDHDTWDCPMAKKPMAYPSVRGESYADALDYIAELEAERDTLKAELEAACTVTFEETEMGECHGEDSTVPFEEHAEEVRMAFDEAAFVYDGSSAWHVPAAVNTETEWAESDAKARLDERRENKDVLITLHNAGQGNPLHDEDPTV